MQPIALETVSFINNLEIQCNPLHVVIESKLTTKLIQTRDSISRHPMTIRVSPRTGGIDVTTIYGKHDSVEQFDSEWEKEVAGTRLMNFVPLTLWGARELRDSLTKLLETEDDGSAKLSHLRV